MPQHRARVSDRLPDFPWDSLAGAKKTAGAHGKGMINLSVGTPVDDVSPTIQLALAESAAEPGYPQTKGTPELRQALTSAMERRYGVEGLDPESNVLPVVGTKEAIAWLPMLLGVGEGHTVVIPELAYPTYEVAAQLCGADVLRSDSLLKLGPQTPSLIYINSPANPHGKVLGVDHLRKFVEFARERDCVVVSDECYLGLGFEGTAPVSILDPEVCGGDFTNLIAVHSLSKTSNMASYRAGWLAGDTALIAELLEVRRHAGLMVPGPIQAAMTTALNTDEHEQLQKMLYAGRRTVLKAALEKSGFTIEDSEGGLYLWVTERDRLQKEATPHSERQNSSGQGSEGRPFGRITVDRLAEIGILTAPGDFYGPRGRDFVRVGLTAKDEQIQEAADRIVERFAAS